MGALDAVAGYIENVRGAFGQEVVDALTEQELKDRSTTLANPSTIGTDGQAPGNATTFQFPLPDGVPSRYGLRSNVGVFEGGTPGEYKDSLLQIGYNLDRGVPTDVVNTLNFESKFRQNSTSPFATETIFSWQAPDGTARRPYQFSVEYSGANIGRVKHHFAGKVSVFDSPAGVERLTIEDGAFGVGAAIRIHQTTLITSRATAETQAFLRAQTNSVDLAVLDFEGSLGLGAAPAGEGRLYLQGPGDMPRVFFNNTTRGKTFYMGALNNYLGDFVLDQSGVGTAFRVKHTTGYNLLRAPAAVMNDVDFQGVGGFITFSLDEAANSLKVKAIYSNGATYKIGTLALA